MLAPGQQDTYCFDTSIPNSTAAPFIPLTATLVWTDPPGSPLAASALVNNLDLTLQQPNGVVLFGNGGAGPDTANNVERIVVARPNSTLPRSVSVASYRVIVRAASLPRGGAQNYSLVVTGPGVALGVLDGAGQCVPLAPFIPAAPSATPSAAPGAPSTAAVVGSTIFIATAGGLGGALVLAAGIFGVLYARGFRFGRPLPYQTPIAWGKGDAVTPNALRASLNDAGAQSAARAEAARVPEAPAAPSFAAPPAPAVAEWGAPPGAAASV